MVDRIIIKLRNFSGNFGNCTYKSSKRKLIKDHKGNKVEYSYDNYILANPKGYELQVRHNKNTGSLKITGSLRRKTIGNTHNDLNKDTFVKSLKKLSEELGIEYEELLNASFSECELGLTTLSRIPALKILPMVVRYSTYKRNPKFEKVGTVYFKGSKQDLKLYVKDKEIVETTENPSKQKILEKVYNVFRNRGRNFLRIEFTLKSHSSFVNIGYNYIRTIGELVDNYSVLYELWAQEVARIVIFNKIDHRIHEESVNDALILSTIEESGVLECINVYQKSKVKNAKTKSSIKTARNKANKDILAILDKYYDKKEYNIVSFRVDAFKTLLRKSKPEDIDILKIASILLGFKPKKSI